MFMGIISRTSSKMAIVGQTVQELWPLDKWNFQILTVSVSNSNIVRFFSKFGTISMNIISRPSSKMIIVGQAIQELLILILLLL